MFAREPALFGSLSSTLGFTVARLSLLSLVPSLSSLLIPSLTLSLRSWFSSLCSSQRNRAPLKTLHRALGQREPTILSDPCITFWRTRRTPRTADGRIGDLGGTDKCRFRSIFSASSSLTLERTVSVFLFFCLERPHTRTSKVLSFLLPPPSPRARPSLCSRGIVWKPPTTLACPLEDNLCSPGLLCRLPCEVLQLEFQNASSSWPDKGRRRGKDIAFLRCSHVLFAPEGKERSVLPCVLLRVFFVETPKPVQLNRSNSAAQERPN